MEIALCRPVDVTLRPPDVSQAGYFRISAEYIAGVICFLMLIHSCIIVAIVLIL